MKRQINPEDDSVVRFIEVKNPVAKKYFDYQLGRFRAAARDKVRNYENAMSKEGRVSVTMDSYFLRFDQIRFYCLGQESIELNRIKAAKRLENLKQIYGEYHEQLTDEKVKESYLDTQMQFFGEYNYDACREYEKAVHDCSGKVSGLASLKAAQKNNLEYMELARRVEVMETELVAVETERTSVYDDKSAMQILQATSKKDYEKAGEDIDIV